jgi:hypothetical protein
MQVSVQYRPIARLLECRTTDEGRLIAAIPKASENTAVYLRDFRIVQDRMFPIPRKLVFGTFAGTEGSDEGKKAWKELYLSGGRPARLRWHAYGPSRQLMAPTPNSPFSSGDIIRIGPDDSHWFPQVVVLNPR